MTSYEACGYWRGGRAVEGDGLENRCRGNSTVSSNLTPSAIDFIIFHIDSLKKVGQQMGNRSVALFLSSSSS